MSDRPADDSMPFNFPAHVSEDSLCSISTARVDALVAHGPGMVSVIISLILTEYFLFSLFLPNEISSELVKISDITTSLLDVLTCAPSLRPDMLIQARQTLHELCCYHVKLNNNCEELDWLCKRLTGANVLFQPVRELPAISELQYDESDLATPRPLLSDS